MASGERDLLVRGQLEASCRHDPVIAIHEVRNGHETSRHTFAMSK